MSEDLTKGGANAGSRDETFRFRPCDSIQQMAKEDKGNEEKIEVGCVMDKDLYKEPARVRVDGLEVRIRSSEATKVDGCGRISYYLSIPAAIHILGEDGGWKFLVTVDGHRQIFQDELSPEKFEKLEEIFPSFALNIQSASELQQKLEENPLTAGQLISALGYAEEMRAEEKRESAE